MAENVADETMQNLITAMVGALVDDRESLKVEVERAELATMVRVSCAAGDLGKLIGKQGRTARSMRTIMGAAGMRLGVHYQLDIERHQPSEAL